MSKDRAMQLHLLLDSLYKNTEDLFQLKVLYTSSDETFRDGYKLTQSIFPDVVWIEEGSFKDDVVGMLNEEQRFSCFFTDDNIFYRKQEFSEEIVSQLSDRVDSFCCVSLRLGKNTKYEYIHDEEINTEILNDFYKYKDEIRLWNYNLFPAMSNFGYPLSVDGHIYKTAYLKNFLSNLDFNNPNEMEGEMCMNRHIFPSTMGCFDTSYIVNTPINRVQETCLNPFGDKFGISQGKLNTKYLNGTVIDFDKIDFSDIIGCHQELELHFKEI